MVVVRISDSGPAIPTDLKEQIFDPLLRVGLTWRGNDSFRITM